MALHLLIVYNRWLQRYIEKLFELYATFGTGDQKVYFFTLFSSPTETIKQAML